MNLPFAPFAPDRSPFAIDASSMIRNCIPRVDGHGPLPKFVYISEPLPNDEAPKGGIAVRTSTGGFRIIVGTTTALYELDTSTTPAGWTDLTGSSGPYGVPQGDRWSFKEFGANLFACNLTDALQFIGIDAGTQFADVAGSPPKAKYVDSIGDFLVLLHLATDPKGIRTSAFGNAGSWSVGVGLASDQSLQDGEDIQGTIGGTEGQLIILQRKKIRQMVITQDVQYPFGITVLNPSRGTISPLSIAGVGINMFGYLSPDGFYLGVEGKPIGAQRVDNWFQSQVDLTLLPEVRGVADPYQKIIWWQATRPDQTQFMIGYHWQLDQWCYSDQNTAELLDLVTPGVTWDGADDLFADWLAANIPWGSRILTGGQPTFAGFDSQNRLGFFTGGNMAARLNTAQAQLTTGQRSFLSAARVNSDCAEFTLTVGTVGKHGELRTTGAPVSPFPSTGICHFRRPGLLHDFQMDIAEDTSWSIVTAVDLTMPGSVGPEGGR